MLVLGSETFAIGRLSFCDQASGGNEASAKLYVPIRVGAISVVAQLDTGAAWTVLNAEVAAALGLLDGGGPQIPLATRFGQIVGNLERVNVGLIAVDGASLQVDATVFVSREWSGQNFIGWSGFLERVRFAVDPSRGRQHFYFGPVAV